MSDTVTLSKFSFDDAGTFASFLSQSDVQCMQTTPGGLKLELAILRTAGIELHLTSLPFGECIALGKAAENTRSFHVPLNSAHPLIFMGQRSVPNVFATYGDGGELAVSARSGSRLAYIVPNREILSAAGHTYFEHEPNDDRSKTTVATADPTRMAELQALLKDIAELTTISPGALEKSAVVKFVEQALIERLLAVSAADVSSRATGNRTPGSRASIMRRVDDHLRLMCSEAVDVADLCRAAGVSQPTLFRVFYEIVGIGPKQYLQMRRLHLARNRLMHDPEPNLTVQTAAHDLGFWHLGRFGSAYRALFGETPSQTLRRSGHRAPAN